MTFADFLAAARRGTYAIPTGTELGDGTSHMVWSEGPWLYRDRYAGDNPYGGQELVQHNGQAVWMKNYMAEVLSDVVPADDLYAFQRFALGQPDPTRLMRGPDQVSQGRFSYATDITGDIFLFQGSEVICWDDTPVYQMILHGGALRPDLMR